MKKHLVIGLGVSGRDSAAFLLQEGERVLAVDKKADVLRSDPEIQALLAQGLELDSDRAEIAWTDIFVAILSPGVPPEHPLVQKAAAFGIEVVGEIELALRYIRNRCVGITGTNGKTTTVLLIAHILNGAGLAARALGNVGDSLSGYLLYHARLGLEQVPGHQNTPNLNDRSSAVLKPYSPPLDRLNLGHSENPSNVQNLTARGIKPNPKEILVLELSSFQLETMRTKCLEAAMVLNITPDHLDRYPSMKEYAEAKLRIEDCLIPGGIFWVSRAVKEEFHTRGEVFDPSVEFTPWSDEKVAAISTLRYIQLGVPEKQNIQAAYSICTQLGVSKSEFRRGLKTFRKPAHRIEWVAEKNGVVFYNDSKATNIDSVVHAVGLFDGPLILLAGGIDKGASYEPWINCFRDKVKMIIAFGQAASKMESELAAAFPLRRVATMQEAVEQAAKLATSGVSVLLSPGCSSYDQFRNYEHRGDEFKRFVRGLA